jgi:hypothetical protein
MNTLDITTLSQIVTATIVASSVLLAVAAALDIFKNK